MRTRDSTPEFRGKIKQLLSQDQYTSSSQLSMTSDSDPEYEDVIRRFVKRQRSKLQVDAEFLSKGTITSVPVTIRVALLGTSFSWHQIEPQTGRAYRDALGSVKFIRIVRISPHTQNPAIVELVVEEKSQHKTMWFKFADSATRQRWETSVKAVWRNVKQRRF